jgi:membrane associated rhomboid family serine protease
LRTSTPVTFGVIVACVLTFVLQNTMGDAAFYGLMLWPSGSCLTGIGEGSVGFEPWQLVTYGFLHGGEAHLFFNMFALWMFGAQLERTWGSQRFARYYLVCVLGAGLVQLVVVNYSVEQCNEFYPTVGASGGVFGLLLAYGMLFPNHRIMLIFPPIPMKARTFVIGYGLLELILGVTRTQEGVAHFAHLGGMLFGFLLLQYWRRRWPFPPPPRRE